MSVISNVSHTKKLPLWKVSVQTKNNNKECTVIHSNYQLPERFSPFKKGPNQSRLLNSSVDRLKLSRFQHKNQKSITPKPNLRASIPANQHLIPSSSMIINNNTSKKQEKNPFVNLNNRESCFSLNSEHVRNIKTEGIRNFIHQHQVNRKIILQVKEEFIMFKKTVLQQMNLQRKMVLDFISKIQQTCNKGIVKQSNLEKQICVTKKEVQSKTDEQVNSLLTFQSNIQTIQNEINNISPVMQIKTPDQKYQIKSSQFKSSQPKTNQLKLEQRVKQSNIYQEINSPQRSKKSSPHLQKCNQIVETISILNQINASSASTPKNPKVTEKQMIQDYKQKILAVTKSNDSLIKQKTRQSLMRTEQQNKVKGSFKLQKFYNAIEKLKEEVNEIKNINELKNNKIIK